MEQENADWIQVEYKSVITQDMSRQQPQDFDASKLGLYPVQAAAFARMVMLQDALVAELNQRGLKAGPHQAGVLMLEEHEVRDFQRWV